MSLAERHDASALVHLRVSCHSNQLVVLALGVLPYAPTVLFRYWAKQAPLLHLHRVDFVAAIEAPVLKRAGRYENALAHCPFCGSTPSPRPSPDWKRRIRATSPEAAETSVRLNFGFA